MGTINITIPGFKCEKCSHVWATQKLGATPKMCPKCKNKFWNDKKVKKSKK